MAQGPIGSLAVLMSGYERRIGHSVLAAVLRAAHPDTYPELRSGKRHRHLMRWRGVPLTVATAILRAGRWRVLCHEGKMYGVCMIARCRSDTGQTVPNDRLALHPRRKECLRDLTKVRCEGG
jgi:hypothetical protein